MAHLPHIRRLSFSCEHFAPCPVAEVPGYWNFVLSTITSPYFEQLDSQRIEADHFQQAQNEFMDQVLKLQETLQDVENEHRHAVMKHEAKIKENEDHIVQMQREVLQEVNNLNFEVVDGRKKIAEEQARLSKNREAAEVQLRNDFQLIQE